QKVGEARRQLVAVQSTHAGSAGVALDAEQEFRGEQGGLERAGQGFVVARTIRLVARVQSDQARDLVRLYRATPGFGQKRRQRLGNTRFMLGRDIAAHEARSLRRRKRLFDQITRRINVIPKGDVAQAERGRDVVEAERGVVR